jgi:rod shape-determining protein MreB
MSKNGKHSFWQSLQASWTTNIGIDLGTANTLVYVAGHEIVISEPSVVAINRDTGGVVAVGAEAKRMLGRTPANIVAVRPLKDGVIAEFDQTMQMLRYFIHKAAPKFSFRRRVVVGIPSGVSEVERRSVIEAARKAGATDAYVLEEPMAAAIGAGLPIEEAMGSIIVDIGGGTTEVAVISLAGIVYSRSIRVAGDEIDEAISEYLKTAHNLYIGDRTAEEVKLAIGSAYILETELETDVRGRDMLTGLPSTITIRSEEIRQAIAEPVNQIVEAVKDALEHTPPELAADAIRNGITLAGGGALLRGIDKLIERHTHTPVHIAPNPLACVALGTGKVVEAMNENDRIRHMLERTST